MKFPVYVYGSLRIDGQDFGDFAVVDIGPTPTTRGVSPLALARRVTYGGRKGRRAERRLAAMGLAPVWEAPDGRKVRATSRGKLAELSNELLGRRS